MRRGVGLETARTLDASRGMCPLLFPPIHMEIPMHLQPQCSAFQDTAHQHFDLSSAEGVLSPIHHLTA